MARLTLFIDKQVIELGEDIALALTYKVKDFRDDGFLSQSFSQTITLPATDLLNRVFSSLFDMQVDANYVQEWDNGTHFAINNGQQKAFDRNDILPARIFADGICVFDGWTTLDRIKTEPVEYEITLFGDGAKWVEPAKTLQLIDLTEYKQIACFDKTFLLALFTDPLPNDKICAPLIDYGALSEDNSPGNPDINIENIFPSCFVNALLRAGFAQIGYQLINKIQNDTERLIMPFTNPAWLTTMGAVGGVAAAASATQKIAASIPSGTTTINYDYDQVSVNNGALYNSNLYGGLRNCFRIDCAACGDVKIRAKFRYSVLLEGITVAFPFTTVKAILYDDTLTVRGTQIVSLVGDGIAEIVIEGDGFYSACTYFFLQIQITNPSPGNLAVTEFLNDYEITLLKRENAPFHINKQLPSLTFADFVRIFVRMFNLIIKTDEQTKQVIIDTRDNYYLSVSDAGFLDKIRDWGEKLDTKKQAEITFCNADLARKIRFLYDNDDDTLLGDFKKANPMPYAAHEIENTLKRGSDTTEIMVEKASATRNYNLKHDLAWLSVPLLTTEKIDSLPVANNTDRIARILIYQFDANAPGWTLLSDDGASMTSISGTPRAYFEGTYGDLRFAPPSGLYKYYQREYELLFSARAVLCFMTLTVGDVATLDFGAPVLIANIFYYLNKIDQFAPGREQLTRCELVEIK